jgi:aryl-alcohol dehydrogenase-like predicted oxidoreductase
MGSGVLTGAFSRERLEQLPADDWRRADDDFKDPFFRRSLDLVERLRPLADGLRASLAALAAAWTLHTPGVTGAICGARRPDQIDDWLPAADLTLDADTLAAIETALDETGAGDEIFEESTAARDG